VSAFRQSPVGTAVINAAVAALVVVATVVSGTMDSSNTTLVLMGFDTDRAQLITSLLVGGVAAAAASLVTNRSSQATFFGLIGFAALFGHTFLHETRSALASTGVYGSFDLAGWLLTLLTLIAFGVISGWAGAVLALWLRPGLIEAGSAVRDAVRGRRLDRQLRRPLTVAVVLVLLIVTVPVFGDMVNYTPDSRMLHGGEPPVGLIPGPVDTSGLTTGSPSPSGQTAANGASQSPSPTSSLLAIKQPWLAWLPSGGGSVTTLAMPAPWTGGKFNIDVVAIYTPPGYNPSGNRHYPVLYEAPFNYNSWNEGGEAKATLDTLIDTGAIPPMLVVFVDATGGPYTDTECANSVDGREWMDTFISQTLVSYVDTHYLTIAQADARALIGFSEGGYCSAILALRHPTVFGTAIPMSGYFWAGEGAATSGLPFKMNAAALAAASPMVVATELPAVERSSLFFIVIAEPSQPFYGAQASGFEQILATWGYPYVVQGAAVPHGWVQVRQKLPTALEAWATHLVRMGVFAS
jgi:enterochelin esterase-like enzyme